ncbi:MAG: adenylyltransferase/cytidyltransferase family protein [Gammaproteobacteria bacterium]|nr:adenylyltransferase/cytidyltransferase family protein [Gammaproteobacteria bacterium]
MVSTNGCFDIVHAGHVGYLEQARTLGDRLVVAINGDASVRRLKGPGRPVHRAEHRARVLAGLAASGSGSRCSTRTLRSRCCELLAPDVLVKGGDYAIDQVVGADLVRARRRVGGCRSGLPTIPCLTSAIVARLRTGEEGRNCIGGPSGRL